MKEFDNMHKDMFGSNFGKMDSLMKNDPFFSDSGIDSMFKNSFSRANSMMNQMMESANSMMRGNMDTFGSAGGKGKFMQQKFVSSTKMGPDGRPVKESYQTKTNGVYGGSKKPEILERKQMYQNSQTGYEKAAVERMYQGKGRKVVYENEKGTGAKNSYNYYKNMREDDAPDFDREWDSAAKRFGLNSGPKALPFGSGAPKQYHRSKTDYGYGDSSYMDERKRGHYVSDRLKGPDMPVNMSREPPTHIERLRPADTGHRLDIPNNRDSGPAIALPSNDNRDQANRLPARNNYTGPVNSRAPNRRSKPARIA
eukprot:CAMPEP_0197005278 /NCGR_PEP_ID=MMETSP1380-20130617/28685_1 /TAXON_ID=5936 /ORGANISM="Euplotes crassus, Strain CT5" /LENGTH=310 /DNA_ID=CAMNT_0042424367 /DNA_START=206 /DNA_END=1138 /DNA_ORIENTATION=-